MNNPKEYKCPSCGSALSYKAGSKLLVCENCGCSFEIDQIERNKKINCEEFNYQSFLENNLEYFEDTKVYQCQSCGAVLETDENTAALSCPYCDNNIVITDRVSRGLKPNAIIPFSVKRDDLEGLLSNYYVGKKLLPNDFQARKVMDKAQGVYVPFWLYDAKAEGRVDFEGQVVSRRRTSDEEITVTKYYRLEREGRLDFQQIPVDAGLKMDDDLMDSIEPFDYGKLTDFDDAYLPGYLANRYDTDPDDEFRRAKIRMQNSFVDRMRQTTGNYQFVTASSSAIGCIPKNIRYAFLPVYLMNCRYQDKTYRYAVNGQSGKVVGELPISKWKSFLWFLLPLLIVAAIAFSIAYFAVEGVELQEALIAAGIFGLVAGIVSIVSANRGMHTVSRAGSAWRYQIDDSFELWRSNDVFIRETVDRVPINKK